MDSSGNSHTAASSNQYIRPHPADFVDLLLPSSPFPLLPPQIETRPWLCPTTTTHLQLFWCQLAAASSSICTYSSFSWVRISGKHWSPEEAAFLGHQPSRSPCHHAGITPCLLLEREPQGGSCPWQPRPRRVPMHTQDVSMVPSISFEDELQVEWCSCLQSSASHPLVRLTAPLPISKELCF